MPSINTSHFVSHGKWDVNHRRCPATGSTLFDLSLVVDHIDAMHVVGLSEADLDELMHELKSAAQDADITRMADRVERLLPRDSAGVDLASAAKPSFSTPRSTMESWKTVWQKGFAPQISTEALQALQRALECDDVRLLQGATTTPPPLSCVQDWPVEAACLIGFCGAVEGHDEHGGFAKDDAGKPNPDACTVAEVEEYFARRCFNTDQILREPGGCRWLLNWFDETPRDEMRQLLLTEVRQTLSERQ